MPGKKIALALILLLFIGACLAADIDNTDNVQSAKVKVIVEGSGKIEGNLLGQNAEIEVLSFPKTPRQKILSISESFEINGKSIPAESKLDKGGNNYALFKVNETGSFSYKIEAVIETNVAFPDLQEYNLETKITENQEFLNPTENIESNSEAIRTAALNLFESESWLNTVVDVTAWTYESVEYNLDYYPETYSAETTLRTKKGVCDEFAVLAAAMLRAKGIPTKIVTGLAYNPLEEQGWNNHAWLEAFNPNSGWVSLDPTFGEAGVVDGTHIARGTFPDPEKSSVVKAIAVQTATVSVEEKNVRVEIYSSKEFGKVFSIDGSDVVMQANAWHDLEVDAKNELNGNVIGWFSLAMPPSFTAEKKKRLMLFKPGESKQLTWKVRIDKQIEENEYLTGTYLVSGIGQELRKNLKVMPATGFSEEAEVQLVELLPLVEGEKLLIEVTLENIGAKEANVEIALEGITETVKIAAFERRTASVSVSPVENRDYSISLNGPGLEYETVVTVHEGIPFEKPAENSLSQIPVIDGKGLIDDIVEQLFTTETFLIAAIIIGIAAIGLLLKELLSR